MTAEQVQKVTLAMMQAAPIDVSAHVRAIGRRRGHGFACLHQMGLL
jgi:hypothetical protein